MRGRSLREWPPMLSLGNWRKIRAMRHDGSASQNHAHEGHKREHRLAACVCSACRLGNSSLRRRTARAPAPSLPAAIDLLSSDAAFRRSGKTWPTAYVLRFRLYLPISPVSGFAIAYKSCRVNPHQLVGRIAVKGWLKPGVGAKPAEWSGREDLNLRPPGPEKGIRSSC